MHVQRMMNRRNRMGRAHTGNEIDKPAIDYVKLAQSMGWYAEGPISSPRNLGPALKRAIAIVKRGEPALLDVIVASTIAAMNRMTIAAASFLAASSCSGRTDFDSGRGNRQRSPGQGPLP